MDLRTSRILECDVGRRVPPYVHEHRCSRLAPTAGSVTHIPAGNASGACYRGSLSRAAHAAVSEVPPKIGIAFPTPTRREPVCSPKSHGFKGSSAIPTSPCSDASPSPPELAGERSCVDTELRCDSGEREPPSA